MDLLIPPPTLKLPARLLDPEVTPRPTSLNIGPVAIHTVAGRTRPERQAVRAEPQVRRRAGRQLREQRGHVKDAQRQVARVLG